MDSLVLPIAASALIAAGGTAATYWYDRDGALAHRVAAGVCVGLAAFGLSGLALAARAGLVAWIVPAASAVAGLPLLLFASGDCRRGLRRDLAVTAASLRRMAARPRMASLAAAAALVLAGALLWRVVDRVIYARPDGIYTGVSHNIGDLPFHVAATNRFLYGGSIPPEHPSFAGAGFAYPYLTDFIAAMFVRAGAPMRGVFVWSAALLCIALAVLLYRWTLALTGSRLAAAMAPPLAFFSGGLGWWIFVMEAWRDDAGLAALLARLPHDYTITRDNAFRWGNVVTTLLLTQRGLLLGLPLALVVFQICWETSGGSHDREADRRRMIAGGVIAGTLPLVHAHSFAVVLGAGACLALLSRDRRAWAPFFAWALALGLPQVWWMAQGSGVRAGAFVAWAVGWDRGAQHPVVFWLKNTGAFIPLLAAAILWRGERPPVPRRLLLFYLPFAVCFIGPNLVRLAPWIWDNIKVLIYWFIGSIPLVAAVLARCWHAGRASAALAGVLFVSLTLAGALDVWRVASGAFEARVFDAGGIEFARLVTRHTPPGALLLHAPVHNHPVALTGRRSLMGYPGHVWSHGLDPGPREADIRRMYAGGTGASALLERYRIEYVVLGPIERMHMPVNEPFFERFSRVVEAGGHRLYRVAVAQE